MSYLEEHDLPVVTTEAAVAWAKATPRSISPVCWSRRMLVARLFARHLNAIDPIHQIPPPDILNHYSCRRVPHVYTLDEVATLMDVAPSPEAHARSGSATPATTPGRPSSSAP